MESKNIELTLKELGLLVEVLDESISDSEARFNKFKSFSTNEHNIEVQADIKSLYRIQDKILDALGEV
jgi:hypothetical protein